MWWFTLLANMSVKVADQVLDAYSLESPVTLN